MNYTPVTARAISPFRDAAVSQQYWIGAASNANDGPPGTVRKMQRHLARHLNLPAHMSASSALKMASSISPIGETNGDAVRTFLRRIGMAQEVIEWRYFDAAFNRGRARGFVWLRQDRVEGMLGLIPFVIAGRRGTREAHWSCDWAVANPDSTPGIGVLLVQHAIANGGFLGFGGNATTQNLAPRMAGRTIADGGLGFHLLLRGGAILQRLQSLTALPLPKPRLLRAIPLRTPPRRRPEVRTEVGVARAIEPLLELPRASGWYPRYDFNYVDWQVGRSPVLDSYTSYVPAGTPRAAALYWSPRGANEFWKIALWWHTNERDLVEMVLAESVATIYRLGGSAVSAVASRLDHELIHVYRSAGFYEGRTRRPLYLFPGEGSEVDELSGLSYLDADLAYRFNAYRSI